MGASGYCDVPPSLSYGCRQRGNPVVTELPAHRFCYRAFIQKKTKRRCVTPLPEHVVEMLNALPGQMKDGKKYFFTCTYTALRMRVDTLAERAQKDKKFTHAFSPHCLRHTFAIQHLNVGTDVKLISKWLGHESVAVTLEHYGNWIRETQRLAEDVSRDANAKMMAKVASLRDQANTERTTPRWL